MDSSIGADWQGMQFPDKRTNPNCGALPKLGESSRKVDAQVGSVFRPPPRCTNAKKKLKEYLKYKKQKQEDYLYKRFGYVPDNLLPGKQQQFIDRNYRDGDYFAISKGFRLLQGTAVDSNNRPITSDKDKLPSFEGPFGRNERDMFLQNEIDNLRLIQAKNQLLEDRDKLKHRQLAHLRLLAQRSARTREDVLNRVKQSLRILFDCPNSSSGQINPGNPRANVFFRLVAQLRLRTLESVEAVAQYQRALGQGKVFQHDGVQYMEKITWDTQFLFDCPLLKDRMQGQKCKQDPFFKTLTLTGLPVEQASDQDAKTGHKKSAEALRLRMAMKYLYSQNLVINEQEETKDTLEYNERKKSSLTTANKKADRLKRTQSQEPQPFVQAVAFTNPEGIKMNYSDSDLTHVHKQKLQPLNVDILTRLDSEADASTSSRLQKMCGLDQSPTIQSPQDQLQQIFDIINTVKKAENQQQQVDPEVKQQLLSIYSDLQNMFQGQAVLEQQSADDGTPQNPDQATQDPDEQQYYNSSQLQLFNVGKITSRPISPDVDLSPQEIQEIEKFVLNVIEQTLTEV